MKEYLKSYQACLKVTGPVFVGSGHEITKKEYVLFKGKNKVGVLNMPAFYEALRKRHLQYKFDRFILDDSRSDLRHWLQENRISTREISPYFRYVLNTGEIQMRRKTQVMEFIKDPYDCPYVPGSSLKGMFRTFLLASIILDDSQRFSQVIEKLRSRIPVGNKRNIYLNKEMKQIEGCAFHTLNRNKLKPQDAVNDALSGLIVSDSEPLDISQLILCQKYDRNISGDEKPLPLMRECLKPGTDIRFTITIDESKLPVTKEDILHSVSNFNQSYNSNFLSKFNGVKLADKDMVYLGGGGGFATKTILYPALGDEEGVDAIVKIFEKTRVPSSHRHYLDKNLGVSPHIVKCTHYMGKSYQMGQCRLSIE